MTGSLEVLGIGIAIIAVLYLLARLFGKTERPQDTHCWEDGPRIYRDYDTSVGSTCMLFDGHDGPHRFTPDSDIKVAFKK